MGRVLYVFVAIVLLASPAIVIWLIRGPDVFTSIEERQASLQQRLGEHGLKSGQPVFIRIFKESSELELWMNGNGKWQLFANYPICKWSGRLGPKLKEGDRQAPEGFYEVRLDSLNPNSRWHLSFNLGFPNKYDRAHGRTGSFLMVHGGCSSIGCYAMTNAGVDEIYGLTEAALRNGQRFVPVHIFPFRMTGQAMSAHGNSEWIGFWENLQRGYQAFEVKREIPKIRVSGKQYVIGGAMKVSDLN